MPVRTIPKSTLRKKDMKYLESRRLKLQREYMRFERKHGVSYLKKPSSKQTKGERKLSKRWNDLTNMQLSVSDILGEKRVMKKERDAFTKKWSKHFKKGKKR